MFREAFLAESCSPSLSSLLLNFRSSSNILTWSTTNSNLALSRNTNICFRIPITDLKITGEVVKRDEALTLAGHHRFWAGGCLSSWKNFLALQKNRMHQFNVYSSIHFWIITYRYLKVCNTHLEMGENPEVKKKEKVYNLLYIHSHLKTNRWKKKKKSDLGREGELGRFCFAGSVNGCEWRGPWLSHFLRGKKKRKMLLNYMAWVNIRINQGTKWEVRATMYTRTFRISSTQLASPDP